MPIMWVVGGADRDRVCIVVSIGMGCWVCVCWSSSSLPADGTVCIDVVVEVEFSEAIGDEGVDVGEKCGL